MKGQLKEEGSHKPKRQISATDEYRYTQMKRKARSPILSVYIGIHLWQNFFCLHPWPIFIGYRAVRAPLAANYQFPSRHCPRGESHTPAWRSDPVKSPPSAPVSGSPNYAPASSLPTSEPGLFRFCEQVQSVS
jgi:hypothetical protein